MVAREVINGIEKKEFSCQPDNQHQSGRHNDKTQPGPVCIQGTKNMIGPVPEQRKNSRDNANQNGTAPEYQSGFPQRGLEKSVPGTAYVLSHSVKLPIPSKGHDSTGVFVRLIK